MIITIDGPVASGKSSVALFLAHDLKFYYLYTGLLYRGVAYILAQHYRYTPSMMHSPLPDDLYDILHNHQFVYGYTVEEKGAFITFDKEDITPFLKTAAVDAWSSCISASLPVRQAILHLQVTIAEEYNIVADGRDMGTVVFPQAAHKFYLTADKEIRALRWQNDQRRRENNVSLQESIECIQDRDNRDQNRKHSPLTQASDAIVIDNSHLSIYETVKLMRSQIRVS